MHDNLASRLIEKAKEAFVLAIEIYNKPTIRYRVEGFAFFICNAWELMLKAALIERGEPVCYPDNPRRTITLERCLEKVLTNEKSPMRANMRKIIELRNASTHFVTEEHEMVYVPLFQACLLNFVEKMQELHGVDMTTVVPQNFLTLAVSMKALDEQSIRAKYPEEIASRLLNTRAEIDALMAENNDKFAISIEHRHFITKNRNEATSLVHVDKNAAAGVKIVKEMRDPNATHQFSATRCIEEINKRLHRAGKALEFNRYHFKLLCRYFALKEQEAMCFTYSIHKQPTYSYSMRAVEFLVEVVVNDPEVVAKAKAWNEQQKS